MRDRGQLVLIAAVVVALAFVPVLFAYLQFGYAGDASAMTARDDTGAATVAALDRSVDTATPLLAQQYAWGARSQAVAAYRDALDTRIDGITDGTLAAGGAVIVAYDADGAAAYAGAHCPSGVGRAFGPCEAHDGVVVQERDGRAHVVAVAVDVTVVTGGSETRLSVVVERAG
ncbi:hypothetical protein EFA46_005665 [Halarchaeum sp. CBA1220]|uniref:DUF7261 family protein n=1 Tax=Halarchaeum sp. CBA1220 TaxID=1853682 RepID=UPI000F3A8A0A|nr:hypothetical protein [Halarchaeum sp. CBA1220]QLC33706.1 hypothetical protein EFA46_005665 [Halarchaeum sp. CBA1220]